MILPILLSMCDCFFSSVSKSFLTESTQCQHFPAAWGLLHHIFYCVLIWNCSYVCSPLLYNFRVMQLTQLDLLQKVRDYEADYQTLLFSPYSLYLPSFLSYLLNFLSFFSFFLFYVLPPSPLEFFNYSVIAYHVFQLLSGTYTTLVFI
jgi:hypothetical protein